MGMRSGKTLRRAKSARAKKTRGSTKAKAPRKAAKRAAAKRSTPKRAAPAVATEPADRAMRELARRIVDLTVANDDEASLALYADDVESTEMGMEPTVGIDAIRQKFVMWRSMVTDAHFTARNVWVDGDTIIIEWVGRVTLAGSGREVDFPEIAIHQIVDGQIARERFYYDPSLLRS
jgi:ketosteroid isomerase-like protein